MSTASGSPRSIRAVVFDLYGTLVDVHSVAARCDELFPGQGDALSRLWRSKQLEYTWLRSLMGRYVPFRRVTEDALNYACASLKLGLDDDGRTRLMMAYLALEPYAEVAAVLDRLGAYSRCVLSNGEIGMVEPVLENAGVADRLEAVISVDEVGIYKPDPRVYRLATQRLGVAANEIAFLSANGWDICGATAYGFWTCWVNRSGAPPEQLDAAPAAVIGDLSELPALLGTTGTRP